MCCVTAQIKYRIVAPWKIKKVWECNETIHSKAAKMITFNKIELTGIYQKQSTILNQSGNGIFLKAGGFQTGLLYFDSNSIDT